MTSDIRDHMAMKRDGLDTEAARWFVRINTGEPDIEEIADWQRWLIADEAHRNAFMRFEKLWQTIGKTKLDSGTQIGRKPVAFTAVNLRSIRKNWPRAVAAALLAAVGVTFLLSRTIRLPQLSTSAAVETHTAENRTYFLPDGSRIEVGARSRIVVDFSASARGVILDTGEAYFEVAHEARPFVVRAGFGTITATGTAFNVRHVQDSVAVTVIEGAVNVRELPEQVKLVPPVSSPAPGLVVVRAGEEVTYGRAAEAVETVDTHVATAWRDKHLKFISKPLEYVTADIERYTNIQISITDPAVADLLYTGTVIPDEIDDWLALLPHTFPISVQRINTQAVILKPLNNPADSVQP